MIIKEHGVGDTVACSHNRAVDYFTESINSPCPFTSYKCKDYDTFQAGKCLDCGRFGERCTQMGYFADQSDLRGKVYLNTRSSPPFCGFNYGINFTASGVNTEGKIDVKLIGDFGETDWFSLSSDYEKIQPNKKYTRVFASKAEVGQVNSAQVKYLAKPGFIWGYYGKEVWEAESMETDAVCSVTMVEIKDPTPKPKPQENTNPGIFAEIQCRLYLIYQIKTNFVFIFMHDIVSSKPLFVYSEKDGSSIQTHTEILSLSDCATNQFGNKAKQIAMVKNQQ
ncbi:hypothetical protein KUTeg_016431 [Tegillarca granosa]|uniref:Lipase domain-containing protein n=1 Tax=Tegillarca granosa TaxID=220873 RepID=A0ABQ9EKU6_TEGGR|nr:hypothetical protein KUTeg_016431 [Tegillarca granosa]